MREGEPILKEVEVGLDYCEPRVREPEVRENECIIKYNVKERILKFEKELRELFKSNGFRFTGSGYGCGVRDLCFKLKK